MWNTWAYLNNPIVSMLHFQSYSESMALITSIHYISDFRSSQSEQIRLIKHLTYIKYVTLSFVLTVLITISSFEMNYVG